MAIQAISRSREPLQHDLRVTGIFAIYSAPDLEDFKYFLLFYNPSLKNVSAVSLVPFTQ
jgi:hypothetical protein